MDLFQEINEHKKPPFFSKERMAKYILQNEKREELCAREESELASLNPLTTQPGMMSSQDILFMIKMTQCSDMYWLDH